MTQALKHRYLTENWQGIIQQLVYYISMGYSEYHALVLPEKKRDRWLEIDAKLANKYQTDLSKFQRSRRKEKGLANHVYLRWEQYAFLLRSPGTVPDVPDPDRFHNVRKRPLGITIGTIAFKIHHAQRGVTVHLDRECYQGIKSNLIDWCKRGNSGRTSLLKEFDALNGLPGWAGVIEQKRHLRDTVLSHGKKYGMTLAPADFRVSTRRKIYKVFITM